MVKGVDIPWVGGGRYTMGRGGGGGGSIYHG